MTPSASNRSYILALGALLLALFFWAIMPMILIYFSRYLDHWTANGTRYFFAASFCVPSFVRAFREMVPQERRVLLRAALFPAIAHSFSQLFFGLAPYHNSATMTNFGFRLSIPITSLLGFWLLKNERPLMKSPLFWSGMACAAGGFLLFFGGGLNADGASFKGLLILAGFGVAWGFHTVFVRRNLSAYPPHVAYGTVSLITGSILLLLMFSFGDWSALLRLPPLQWGWLILSSLMGLTLGHLFYYRAIRVLGPIASEASMLLIPFQTAILAHFIMGDRLAPLQWTAGGILILGCSLLLWARFRSKT